MCRHLAAVSEKLWPCGKNDLRRPAQLRLHVGGQELLDHLASERGREPAARHLLAVAMIVSVCVSSSNCVLKVASRSSRISIRKLILGRCCGASGSKRPGPFSMA